MRDAHRQIGSRLVNRSLARPPRSSGLSRAVRHYRKVILPQSDYYQALVDNLGSLDISRGEDALYTNSFPYCDRN